MKSERETFTTTPQDTEAINQTWQHVIDCMMQATLEIVTVDDETRANLVSNFWPTHAALLQQVEQHNPGTAHAIMTRAEEISAEVREQELQTFEQKTLPTAKRRAYMRGFMSVFSLSN